MTQFLFITDAERWVKRKEVLRARKGSKYELRNERTRRQIGNFFIKK